jgi:hypothetical protein
MTTETSKNQHTIFALINPLTQRVFHVGCVRGSEVNEQQLLLPIAVRAVAEDISPQLVILQTVDSAPLFAWVKWSKRFRRDLVTTDWREFSAQSDTLTNSNRVKRAMGEKVPSDALYQEKFHEFDRENAELFKEMLCTAQRLKASGRHIFGVDLILEEIRWGGSDTNHTDRFKINDLHAAFYARKLQMEDPSLCGLFAMRGSIADNLVLSDGRTWQDFAKEHSGALRFVETPDADDDTDWSY